MKRLSFDTDTVYIYIYIYIYIYMYMIITYHMALIIHLIKLGNYTKRSVLHFA